VAAVTDDGIGWDPARGELWFSGETAEALLLELDARRRQLATELEELAARADSAATEAVARAARADAAAAAFRPGAHLRPLRQADVAVLERLATAARSLDETLRVAAAAAARLESPLAERSTLLATELRTIAAREAELRRLVTDTDARALAAERRA